MLSTSLRFSVTTALLVGAAAACSVEDAPPAGAGHPGDAASSPPGASDSALHWAATPGGLSLFDHVTALARRSARGPYLAPERVITPAVADLTYGQLRGISFRTEEAIWRDAAPFEVQLFHPGGGNDRPVRVHLVEGGVSRPLAFDARLFRYGDEVDGIDTTLPPEAGYAGFRVLHPLSDPERMDEVVSFLGASYFRLLGPGHVYGLSSRGLAVDIGRPEGEEFPDFRAFWLERPTAGAPSMTWFALLDGPSVSGAYRFVLTPAPAHTVLAVEARIFARSDIGKLGVAPLTSMYLHGTFRTGGEDDVRPRVHDSEGLLMHTSRREWIWRPLTNRSGVRVTSLRDVNPTGFGLVQRSRDFADFLDLEAQYHRRPSEWVAISEPWGSGGVELLEIPTNSEFSDNVVAYWSPDERMAAGDERTYRYRLVTFDGRLDAEGVPGGPVAPQHLAQVVRTRIGWDGLPGQADPPPASRRRVIVDFAGGPLDGRPVSDLEAITSASSGSLSDIRVQALPDGGRRATFSVAPDGDRSVDIRLYLVDGDEVVTETWSYLLEPPK